MSEINKIARIYCRVSTEEQDLSRQLGLKQWAESRGFYVAKIYAEKASGRHADRPQLLEMIKDLQAGEIVIAESMERLSRLPLAEAEALIAQSTTVVHACCCRKYWICRPSKRRKTAWNRLCSNLSKTCC